jgi:hypothetical protein
LKMWCLFIPALHRISIPRAPPHTSRRHLFLLCVRVFQLNVVVVVVMHPRSPHGTK